MTFLPMTDNDSLGPQWFALRDELVPFVGERAVTLFAYAISDENNCLVHATQFRRTLVGSGDDPDNPDVTDIERLLMDWGRLIAGNPHEISDEFYARLELAFQPQLRATLLSFAGQMVAANVVATVGRVALDPELNEFRKPA